MNINNNSLFTILILSFIIIIFIIAYISSSLYIYNKDDLNITVDVVYKYINLRDKELKGRKLKQSDKDYDNEELRYSIRSVEENIPWINKIYIIMPNNHVPFINETEEVKKKIVYIKDKDILGFDSSSSITFEHAALKNLKRYGVSDTFIYMNDDCFISKPLKKKDYFYYSKKEGRYVPYIMKCRCKYSRFNYGSYKKYYKDHSNLLNSKCLQTTEDYRFQNCNAYLLLYKYFKSRFIKTMNKVRVTFHNALPLSIKDLEEMYEMEINTYKYKDELMNATERNNKQLTFEIVYSFYFLNKYKRKMGSISYMYYGVGSAKEIKRRKYDEYVINKGNLKLTEEEVEIEKIVMATLFNNRSRYEERELDDGFYYIKSMKNKREVLEIKNRKSENDNALFLSSFTGKDNQIFYIYYNNSDGYYRIMNKDINKSLNSKNSVIFNKNIVVEKFSNEDEKEKWNIIPYINNYKYNNSFYINNVKKKKNLGKSFYFTFFTKKLKLEKIKGGKNQVFIFEKVEI